MSKWLFDIEANELLLKATKMWVIVGYNFTTKTYSHWLGDDPSWKDTFNNATHLIGHNICDYDIPLLWKLYGWKPPKKCKLQDTLLMSQTLNYKRFGAEGHSLEVWGKHLGFPKIEINDPLFFTKYSPEMLVYCKNDVELNLKIYDVLLEEYKETVKKNPQFDVYLRSEHAAAKWGATAKLHGWPFDKENAYALFDTFTVEMEHAHQQLEGKLGYTCEPVDKKKGIVEVKSPKWVKSGAYDRHTANWFDVDPFSGYEGEERPIAGDYCRVQIRPLSLDSVNDVKVFLFRNGWVPTTWNYKKDEKGKRTRERSSPKITEDSLEFLGGDGKLFTEFMSTKARYGILKTWLENIDEDDYLHGNMMTIGTPSMRATHSIIVNVPAVDKPWGKEMRALFKCKPGWKVIGCDSSGNQARGLAHYLGDKSYINTLLHGDIHQYNADKLTSILKIMGIKHVVPRPNAKRILYAFLFGASGGKLWSYIFGTIDEEKGSMLKKEFIKAVPGFKDLLDKLEKIYASTKKYGDGYIYSIAGNRLYVDSFHKLLVYLLQGAEKATCSTALMLTVERLEDENIPYIPLIYYHDEIDFMVPEEYSERAAAIGKQAFHDGPLLYGISIMEGGAKIGDNWRDVH